MEVIDTALLDKLIWLPWVAIGLILMFLLRRLLSHDNTLKSHETEIALCRQRDEQRETERKAEVKRRDGQRQEMMTRIDSHHKVVMGRLDTLINGK